MATDSKIMVDCRFESAFESIIQYFYTYTIDLDCDNILQILNVATQFEVTELSRLETSLYPSYLTLKSKCDLVSAAFLFPATRSNNKYENEYIASIVQNFSVVIAADYHLGMPKEAFANFLKNPNLFALEESILDSIIRWVAHNQTERRPYLSSLLELIDFRFIDNSVIKKAQQNYSPIGSYTKELIFTKSKVLRSRNNSIFLKPESFQGYSFEIFGVMDLYMNGKYTSTMISDEQTVFPVKMETSISSQQYQDNKLNISRFGSFGFPKLPDVHFIPSTKINNYGGKDLKLKVNHFSRMGESLFRATQQHSKQFANTTISTNGKKLHIYDGFLEGIITQSLNSSFAESVIREWEYQDPLMETVLMCSYIESVSVSTHQVGQLISLAHMYDCKNILESISEHLISSDIINDSNCFELLKISCSLDCDSFFQECMKYFATFKLDSSPNNISTIPFDCIEKLIKNQKKNQFQLFKLCLLWIQHDIDTRKHHLNSIVKTIDFYEQSFSPRDLSTFRQVLEFLNDEMTCALSTDNDYLNIIARCLGVSM